MDPIIYQGRGCERVIIREGDRGFEVVVENKSGRQRVVKRCRSLESAREEANLKAHGV